MVRSNFLCLILRVFMDEEHSEEEFYDHDSTPVGEPSVVTFKDPIKKPGVSAFDRASKKAFMVCNS